MKLTCIASIISSSSIQQRVHQYHQLWCSQKRASCYEHAFVYESTSRGVLVWAGVHRVLQLRLAIIDAAVVCADVLLLMLLLMLMILATCRGMVLSPVYTPPAPWKVGKWHQGTQTRHAAISPLPLCCIACCSVYCMLQRVLHAAVCIVCCSVYCLLQRVLSAAACITCCSAYCMLQCVLSAAVCIVCFSGQHTTPHPTPHPTHSAQPNRRCWWWWHIPARPSVSPT